MRVRNRLIGGLLLGMLLAACQTAPLRSDAATTKAVPNAAAEKERQSVLPKPEPPSDTDRSEVGGLSLTRVQKSETAIPAWTNVGAGEENGRVFQLGKGSSLRSEFEAQQAAMHEAVGLLIRGLLGERIKFRTTVEVKPLGPRYLVRIVALIWFEAEPVRIENFEMSGVYNEVWAGNGQQIFVSWVRMSWPKEARARLLAEHSI